MLVVGGGPAGMAAAARAANAGMAVTIVDEGESLGGQYYRTRRLATGRGSPREFTRRFPSVRVLSETVLFDAPTSHSAAVWSQEHGAEVLSYDAVCVATGAYDRSVPVPGWTLPGVLTAGGAHTLAHGFRTGPGRRMVVAGAGPFLLPVACGLAAIGCSVELVDAASTREYLRGVRPALRNAPLLAEASWYGLQLAKHRVHLYRSGRVITRIHGEGRVESVTIQDVDSDWRGVCGTEVDVAADGVCLSFGFVPQLELPHLLGCSIRYQGESGDFAVVVDANMRTTIEAVFAAGETTGIAGVRVSRVEGQIAGLTAAFDAGVITRTRLQSEVEPLQRVARHLRVFSEWMRLAFRPRPGLWELAEPNTIVCRCEDVDLAQVDGALAANDVSLSAVKSDTRAGMGLCQGRVCGPYIVERLRETHAYRVPDGHLPWSVRPPIRRVPLSAWMQAYSEDR